jgi:hypothetical protein
LFPCMQNLTHWQEARFLLLTLVHLLSAWHIVPQVGILWLQSSRLDQPELLFSEYEDILFLFIEIVFCWFFHYDSLVDSISNKTGAEADKINIPVRGSETIPTLGKEWTITCTQQSEAKVR